MRRVATSSRAAVWASVVALTVAACSGSSDTSPTDPPTSTTSPANAAAAATPERLSGMPTEADLRLPDPSTLRPLASTDVEPGGSYAGVRVTGGLEIPGDVAPTSFTDCYIDDAIVTYSPLVLTRCTVAGGIYSYDTGGTIANSLLLGVGQAFRPGTSEIADALTTSTPWTVTDTIMRIPAGVPPAHVEASQVLGGVGITFRNVVFDTGGPFNNTQTADLNFHGRGLRCEDCWFVGHGGYSVYSAGPDNVFVRPRFGDNAQFGYLYPNDGEPMPTIIEPMRLDGTPIASLG